MDVKRLMSAGAEEYHFRDDVYVTFRRLSPERIASIQTACMVARRVEGQRVETLDGIAFACAVARESISEWRGLTSGDEPYECSADNVDTLVREVPGFAAFVADSVREIGERAMTHRETTEKKGSSPK